MTVSQVLDVTGGSQLAEAGSGLGAEGITLLHEKVTGIVSLDSIPSLDNVVEREAEVHTLLSEEPR